MDIWVHTDILGAYGCMGGIWVYGVYRHIKGIWMYEGIQMYRGVQTYRDVMIFVSPPLLVLAYLFEQRTCVKSCYSLNNVASQF